MRGFLLTFFLTELVVLPGCGTSYSRKVDLPANPSYFNIRETIVKPQCISCHPNFESYEFLMKFVSAGDLGGSSLYNVIDKDEMPPTGKKVADEKKDMLKAWIEQGASL